MILVDSQIRISQMPQRELVEESLTQIFEKVRLASVAFCDHGQPHAFTVYFSLMRPNQMVFVSAKDSHHGVQFSTIPDTEVALTVFDTAQVHGKSSLHGVQLFGRARALGAGDAQAGLDRYLATYPFYDEWKEIVDIVGTDSSKHYRIYTIRFERCKIFDEARFGEETWIEAEFE